MCLNTKNLPHEESQFWCSLITCWWKGHWLDASHSNIINCSNSLGSVIIFNWVVIKGNYWNLICYYICFLFILVTPSSLFCSILIKESRLEYVSKSVMLWKGLLFAYVWFFKILVLILHTNFVRTVRKI